ncbi:MAG: YceI family protein [Moraxellaceae bacterium]|nr:YceI family protein [Moraxellaceae bacterium]
MKRFQKICMFVLLMATSAAWAQPIVQYAIDPAKTTINFTWRYLGQESPKAKFANPAGTIYLNTKSPELSWTEVSIPVKTLSTFMGIIDRELLHSGHFFLPEKHPYITFRSTGITLSDIESMTYSVTGQLTVNGITQTVVLLAKPVGSGASELPGDIMAVEATTHFKRSEFGMTRMLGVVADEMSISLSVLAVKQ